VINKNLAEDEINKVIFNCIRCFILSLVEVRQAARRPINYTADAPKSTPEALKEFAMQRAEMNKQKRRQAVTIRIQPDVLEKIQSFRQWLYWYHGRCTKNSC